MSAGKSSGPPAAGGTGRWPQRGGVDPTTRRVSDATTRAVSAATSAAAAAERAAQAAEAATACLQRVANAAEEAVERRRLSEANAVRRHEEIRSLLRAHRLQQARLQATIEQLVDLLGPFALPGTGPEDPPSEASIEPEEMPL